MSAGDVSDDLNSQWLKVGLHGTSVSSSFFITVVKAGLINDACRVTLALIVLQSRMFHAFAPCSLMLDKL